jgi:hypothetical protein
MKRKTFDCVQMKWHIQQKLAKTEASMSVEERNRHAEEITSADAILGPWFRKVMEQHSQPSRVAEERAEYGTRGNKTR